MKRFAACLLILALLAVPLTACTDHGNATESSASSAPVRAHYTYQTHVHSSVMDAVMGDTMSRVFDNLIDAVEQGKDTFACPDEDTYYWVLGQYPELCAPVVAAFIEPVSDGPVVENGVGRIRYTVPKAEFAEKKAAFQAEIERILNEALEDGDNDFERALSLYVYLSENYTYDYDTYEQLNETGDVSLSAYRFFMQKSGICQEISVAYSFLLLQADLDATVMKGVRSWDGERHQWSYLTYEGKNYHIDPTYGLCEDASLTYFMTTDAKRLEDGYDRSDFVVATAYSQSHAHDDYQATDERFRPLWGTRYVSLDRQTKTVLSVSVDGTQKCFSYAKKAR